MTGRSVQPGDEIEVQEQDYMYGLGAVRLRVDQLGDVVEFGDDGEFQTVIGTQLGRTSGKPLGTRRLMVRTLALRLPGPARS